ncbi:MAG TPA: NADH-quinone oxidoreductase subunit NuoE [Steroidobacteraceae bacterium]|nr:NADH-quinone oxidoreductase subunit NuoE [Steroidobacteraceae bacterium]
MNTHFTPALLEQFDALRRQYPPEMNTSLVLPLLHCVQDANGFVTEADAHAIAIYLGMPSIQVVEALTWYSMFDREPQGRYVIKVCRNIACSLRGSERIVAHLQQRLGIDVGETTPDGRFTLKTVECLASCGTAPAMQVNRTYHEQLDEAKLDAILESLP